MQRIGDVDPPAQAATLAALEERSAQLADPGALLAIAAEIDELGMQLAHELPRHAQHPELAEPLKRVIARVPAAYVRTLLRAAECFDDLGSPRRAAYVLIEALRKSFDAATIATVAEALTFILDAHGQTAGATRVGDLVTARADTTLDRRALRERFLAMLDQLRGAIDWNALDDELGLD